MMQKLKEFFKRLFTTGVADDRRDQEEYERKVKEGAERFRKIMKEGDETGFY